MPAEPEQCVASTELHAERRHAMLGVTLNLVQRRLEPIESHAYQRAIDEAVAHIVEFGAQQPEQQQHAERLGNLLGDRCR